MTYLPFKARPLSPESEAAIGVAEQDRRRRDALACFRHLKDLIREHGHTGYPSYVVQAENAPRQYQPSHDRSLTGSPAEMVGLP